VTVAFALIPPHTCSPVAVTARIFAHSGSQPPARHGEEAGMASRMASITAERWRAHPSVSPSGLANVQGIEPVFLASQWRLLRRMGILRSVRAPQCDFAEWVVAELLGLKLMDDLNHPGYDALDAEGRTYRIEGRKAPYLMSTTSFEVRAVETPFDFLACVFFSEAFDLRAVLRVPYAVVRELVSLTTDGFRFRWNSRMASDARLERILWPAPDAGA
jgi:hypothetical protein